jgi:hypothetical protein
MRSSSCTPHRRTSFGVAVTVLPSTDLFVLARHADDCNIYVRSRRAGERVMASVSRFLTGKAQAKGKRGEKRGGATRGEEVLGI